LILPSRAFAQFDEARHQWVLVPGTYTLHAGRSSRDLGLRAEVVLR
jgi:beta-glucosidase